MSECECTGDAVDIPTNWPVPCGQCHGCLHFRLSEYERDLATERAAHAQTREECISRMSEAHGQGQEHCLLDVAEALGWDAPTNGAEFFARLGQIRAEAAALRERAEKAEARDRALLASVLGTIGGTVEGHPTNSINFLQRLRQLVETERLRDEHEAEMEHHADRVCGENTALRAALAQAVEALDDIHTVVFGHLWDDTYWHESMRHEQRRWDRWASRLTRPLFAVEAAWTAARKLLEPEGQTAGLCPCKPDEPRRPFWQHENGCPYAPDAPAAKEEP